MKTTQILPENYTEILTVDLQKDKKLAIIVNALAIVIGVLMFAVKCFFLPFFAIFDMSDGLFAYFARFGVLLLGMALYIILHEAVHGVTMRLFGATHTRFGFTGIYAFAGSEKDYFGKWQYLTVALAPVLLFGVLFALLELLLPLSAAWRWIIYVLQMINISGAAGDLFVTLRFFTLPRSILVRDTGVSMTVYAEKE